MTKKVFVYVILSLTVSEAYSKVCGHYYQTYQYWDGYHSCGWLNRRYHTCTKYSEYCCTGYEHYPACYPVCHGRTILNNACNEPYSSDRIYYRGGISRNSGGGTCSSPNSCIDCKDGFYPSGGLCLICPSIANCNHRRCSTPSDNYCEWCQYEVMDQRYFRGYTRHYDGAMKQCRKACSWRSDSTRCYPGNCTNEVVESCSCTSGFGGTQCDTITEETSILFAEIKLHNPSHETVTTPTDPSETGAQPIKFTNKGDLNKAEIEFHAKFVASGIPPPLDPEHFVTYFTHGIVYGQMILEYAIGSSSNFSTFSCPATEDYPITTSYVCSRTNTNNSAISLPTFGHSDKLVFTIQARNGGYLRYLNRENSLTSTIRTSLTGITTTRSYTVQWDYITPYYTCLKNFGRSCSDSPIDVTDITDQKLTMFTWKAWSDDLAGVDFYEYEIHRMADYGSVLREANKLFHSNETNFKEGKFNVTQPGMYSIILTAFDKAGNYKSTRSLLFFDDQSVVEKIEGTRTVVKESTMDTNRTWVVSGTNLLHVTWPGRFINERHDLNKWLFPVDNNSHVDDLYDDYFQRRTVNWFTNVKGVVKFDVNYTVSGQDVKSYKAYTNVIDILQETEVLNVVWEDGEKLDIFVKATDIIGKYTEDFITVYRDVTYPVIENLWLSYGNETKIFVHRLEEFTEMTFEFDAFDYHSGLHNVHWKLYDNFTGSEVLHGSSHILAQGNAQNITLCEDLYETAPRGPVCYCTLYHGCFHRHFYIKPEIVFGAGLDPGKDKGLHESDYFIEITVVNQAMLTSVLTRKITIDISPPQPGSVHDGVTGSPEVDYQQDLTLNFHWDGFFDPESGVKYYKYIISDHCQNKDDILTSDQMKETTVTSVSHRTTVEGTYFITVVALNKANDASYAVCSDGVTIVTITPSVKNVVIEGSRTAQQLIEDTNGILWIMAENMTRAPYNKSLGCSASPSIIDDIKLIPETHPSSVTCNQLQTSSTNLLQIVPQTSQMVITWDSVDDERIVFDYEIGYASTRQSLAPDILPFRSTKHHRHIRIDNPDLTEGTLFYIVIKSISKSGVTGYQSIGPIIIDVTPPTYHGSSIDIKYKDGILIANWSKGAFQDTEDPHLLNFQFAIGQSKDRTDVAEYRALNYNSKCTPTRPPECTAIDLSVLDYELHAHHMYYVTIKVTNLAGLSTSKTSEGYMHDVQVPSVGVVYDINPNDVDNKDVKDIIDVDFTEESDSLAVRWKGFHHPHLPVKYSVCLGTTHGSCDVKKRDNIDNSVNQIAFTNLPLVSFQKYFFTVKAITSAGTVESFSDGVMVVDSNTQLSGVLIHDGPVCTDETSVNASHHTNDILKHCLPDIDYQTSTTTLYAKWDIPTGLHDVIRSSWISVDIRSPVGDFWSTFIEYRYIGSHHVAEMGNLDLQPGRTYRFNIKLCADNLCFPPLKSDGVTIIPTAPVTGSIEVQLDKLKITIITKQMYDPDIKDTTEAKEAIDFFEWAIVDGSREAGVYTKWEKVSTVQMINSTHFKFDVILEDNIDLTKCKRIALRGYNKVAVCSEVQTEIKKCNVEDGHSQVIPRAVIDTTNRNEDGSSEDVLLELNTPWTLPDVDYIPTKHVLSAVWPSLRHDSYQWGVLEVRPNDALTFYRNYTDLVITDPCSHPDIIKCGHTENRYINVHFNDSEELIHGKRYSVCVHSERKEIQHEKWTEVLTAVSSCSDGVVVDLTAPIGGNVWVGTTTKLLYQTSSSDIYVTWDSFVDVEEEGYSMHSSGISHYLVSVGSVEDGVDVIDKRNVGVTNHVSFHDLTLQDGHTYYVSVSGVDFISRNTKVHADPVTVDTTPPEVSSESIYIGGRIFTNLSQTEICWKNIFFDIESGIDHYMVGLGSLSGQDDQIEFSRIDQECGNLKPDHNHQLMEGHPYFVTVKAYNRAGLSASKSSLAHIFDISSPVAGHVYDGRSHTAPPHAKDIDYQADTTQLSVYWEGFHDPHSVIKYYRVYIGTCAGCYDIIDEQVVGAHTYFTLSNVDLEAGRRYFSTITACNTGNMCTCVTSDGVTIDNSPPVPGIVQDGSGDYDIEFLSVRDYIPAKWFGFNDVQSNIDYIVVRVGTSPGSADIYPPRIISETDMVIITDLPTPLPPGRRIYTTVRAYNKAGIYTESTSNGFIVDVSPPDALEYPKLSRDIGSITEDTSVLRSAIRFKWDVEDKQSSILRQYISFVSHQNGEFNSSSKMINGILREYTLTDLDLHDGGTYYFKLIVCNGAKICIETESEGILIDTTPPTSGMFAIGTYHAAELTRHTEGWMTWSDYRLNLSWVGFSDLHTGIDKYYVSVGSQFMGNDLNKVPGIPTELSHNDSSVEYKDEGPLQYFVVSTQHLVNYEHVFISVWATNKVGLRSHMIHYQFRLILGGYLDLIRRCDSLTCLGHCVCSPKDQRCHINGQSCRDVTVDNKNTMITVSDILDLSGSPQSDVKFTPSNSLLAAKWKITKQKGLVPQWYEWSVGLSSQGSPEGVIDTSTDPLWRHSGQKTEAIFYLKPGQKLAELYTYSVFVRVWYSDSVYAVFKSNGITVQSRSILVNDQRGSAVSEKIPNFWKTDIDFIKQGSLYTVDWKNVFVSSPGSIKMFNVYLSSYPEGTDLHTVNVNLDPSITALNISRLAMIPSVRYYSNVVARTHSGLQTTASSDGVMVDVNKPVCGLVYDGIGLNDVEYQNRSDITASRWHGYTDLESGIIKYSWCTGSNTNADNCDISAWKNNGMQTSVSFNLQTPLKNGATVYCKVKATDGVGHVSDVMTSNGVEVDTTAPIPVNFIHKDHNYVNNPSFEDNNGCFMNITDMSSTNICGFDNCYHPVSWSLEGCAIIIRSDVNAAYEGRSLIFLKGVIQQNVTQLNIGSIYRLSFVTAHLPIQEALISNLEGSVSFGQGENVFQMYTKSNQSDIVWHRHVFYTKLEESMSLIKFSSLDNHVGFLVDDIRIEEVKRKSGDDTAIKVHTVELHRWSSIHASWLFVDPESSIKEYLWAIGNTEGSAELQDFVSVGVNTFAYNYDLTLVHASQVYVTVVAINGAGLTNVAYSTAIDIDKTPPVLEEVHDGTGVDIDGQTTNTIAVNWKVSDPESGISFCEWSIGLQPLGNELQSFTRTTDLDSASVDLEVASVSQKTIYSTIRCHNKGGLYTTSTSDGVAVSEKPPSIDNAEITIVPLHVTEYSPGDFDQGDTATIRMKWTGFTDQFKILSFVVKLDGGGLHFKNNILNVNEGVTYMSVQGLQLTNDVYTASVAATNYMYIRSSQVYTNITVNQSSPSVKESSMKIERSGDVINVDWQGCFTHSGRLVYEVSVGTFLGGADVIQWQETTNHFIDVKVTEKLKTKSTLKFYIYIRAISDSGLFSTLNDNVSL